MRITTIKYMERKNLGNYEHQEVTAEAVLEDNENPERALEELIKYVGESLGGISPEVNTPQKAAAYKSYIISASAPHDMKIDMTGESANIADVMKPKKQKGLKKSEKSSPEETKPSQDSVTNTSEVIKEEKVKPSKVVKYSSTIPEHKSIFGGYLAKSYGEAWKTASPVEEIKKFTASLNGQDFLNDSGTMVPTFLELVHTFFGMPNNAN